MKPSMKKPTYEHSTIDYRGNIYVPQPIRKALEWRRDETLLISIVSAANRSVLIEPEQARCSFCLFETEGLRTYMRGHICGDCLGHLRRMY